MGEDSSQEAEQAAWVHPGPPLLLPGDCGIPKAPAVPFLIPPRVGEGKRLPHHTRPPQTFIGLALHFYVCSGTCSIKEII